MGFGIGVSSSGMGPRNVMETFAEGDGKRGQVYNQRVVTRMLVYLRPYTKMMTLAFVAMLADSALTLLAPYLLKITIDSYITQGDQVGLIRISMWTATTYVGLYIANRAQQYLLSMVGQHMLANIRRDLFFHLQELSLGYHDTHIVGVTVSRVMNDVATINDLLSQGIITLIGDIFVLVGIIVVMLTMNLRLALLTFAVLPLMLLVTMWFSRNARVAFRETRTSVAKVVGGLAEDIAGVRVIQAFGQEDTTQENFSAVNEVNRKANINAMSLSFIFLPAIEFLGILATAIVLWFGGRAVGSGTVTLGVLVAFLSYVTRFFEPVQELSRMFTTLQTAMAGGEQVVNLLDTVPDVRDQPGAAELTEIAGSIKFEHVSFRYRPELPEVLHDICLEIHPEIRRPDRREPAVRTSLRLDLQEFQVSRYTFISHVDSLLVGWLEARCYRSGFRFFCRVDRRRTQEVHASRPAWRLRWRLVRHHHRLRRLRFGQAVQSFRRNLVAPAFDLDQPARLAHLPKHLERLGCGLERRY